MEDVASNKRKMKELEDNLLYRLTSTQVWNTSNDIMHLGKGTKRINHYAS